MTIVRLGNLSCNFFFQETHVSWVVMLQIRQLRYIEEDNSVNIMTKGRQRFRILKAWQDVDETVIDCHLLHHQGLW